jgi:hypothetical protein
MIHIFVNCNWVDSQWQQYSTQLHTKNTQSNIKMQNTQKRTYITISTCKHNYNTYLLTAWSGVLIEKLTGFQLVKKFPAFYETRKFVTATCPYPVLAQSSPHPHILLPEDPF